MEWPIARSDGTPAEIRRVAGEMSSGPAENPRVPLTLLPQQKVPESVIAQPSLNPISTKRTPVSLPDVVVTGRGVVEPRYHETPGPK